MGVFSPPTEASSRGPDLRVALFVNGRFDFDWEDSELGARIRVESVSATESGEMPRARLSVDLTGEYGPGGQELTPPFKLGDMRSIIDHDTRLVVYGEIAEGLPGGGSGSRVFLFDGYPSVITPKFSGTPGHEFLRCDILCTSALERMSKEREVWIQGRHYGIDDAGTASSRHIEAMPCIFNFRNRPNRATDPVSYLWDGTTYALPAFTGDGDGEYWTYADVLAYLIAHYVHPLGGLYAIQEGNGMARCEDLIGLEGDPQSLNNPNAPSLEDIAQTKCDEMTAEGLDVVSALRLWCELSGCAFQQWTLSDGGEPDTKLLFSAAGDGGPFKDAEHTDIVLTDGDIPHSERPLRLEAEGTPTVDRDPAQILAENQIEAAELALDNVNTITSTTVVGDVEKYEVTLGKGGGNDVFKPGWEPSTMFGDDLSSTPMDDKIDEIDAATSPDAEGNSATMFARYDRRGASFKTESYRYAGRLWILNESGEWDGATLGRSNGGGSAWSSARYTNPYDFHVNCSVPKMLDRGAGGRSIAWVPRRRPVLRLLSTGIDSVHRPPIVECSFDSGSHWYTYPGTYVFLGREDPLHAQCGLYLTDQNLGSVTNDKPVSGDSTEGQSVWECIVRGTFRLAMTCTIPGDARVIGDSGAAMGGGTFDPHRHIHVQDVMRYEGRTKANSDLASAAGWQGDDIDEEEQAKTLANRFVAVNQSRRISGNLVVPWLSDEFLPNDTVSGIQPAGLSFVGSARFPRIKGVQWINGPNSQETHLTLDDKRVQPRGV